MKHLYQISALICFLWLGWACQDKEDKLAKFEPYKGPVIEIEKVNSLYSDSARVKLRIIADRQLEFENGDREFPEGIFLEFFNEEGEINNTLRANYCYYDKKEDLYKAVGDVEIIAYENKQKLNTEELFWRPRDEKVFTEKFVRVESEGEILMGDGLEAKQDFSDYTVKNSRGTITLDQEVSPQNP